MHISTTSLFLVKIRNSLRSQSRLVFTLTKDQDEHVVPSGVHLSPVPVLSYTFLQIINIIISERGVTNRTFCLYITVFPLFLNGRLKNGAGFH
jgi:hypothetical protein